MGINKFVRDTRSDRIVKIEADNQTRTADPLPDNLRNALFMIRADVAQGLTARQGRIS